MKSHALAASMLTAAAGLALALTAQAGASDMAPAKAGKPHVEKCYGINAVARSDCAAGAHSCAGQATVARDPKSYVVVPAGVCSKIAGGSLTAR